MYDFVKPYDKRDVSFRGQKDDGNLFYDVNEKKSEIMTPAVPLNVGKTGARSDFNINITKLARKVKSKDIIKYLPDNLLSEEQKKREAVAKTIRFTRNRNINTSGKYMAIEDGKEAAPSGSGLKARVGTRATGA